MNAPTRNLTYTHTPVTDPDPDILGNVSGSSQHTLTRPSGLEDNGAKLYMFDAYVLQLDRETPIYSGQSVRTSPCWPPRPRSCTCVCLVRVIVRVFSGRQSLLKVRPRRVSIFLVSHV